MLPLRHAPTARHGVVSQINVGGITPLLLSGCRIDRYDPIKGRADHKIVAGEYWCRLPGGLQGNVGLQSIAKIRSFAKISRSVRPRYLQLCHVVRCDGRRTTEMAAACLPSGQRPISILAKCKAGQKKQRAN